MPSAPIHPTSASPLARAVYSFNRALMRQWHQVEVLSPCPIPTVGPGLVVCNHISWLDPAVIQSTCPRPIKFIMAQDMMNSVPGLAWMVRQMDVIAVAGTARDAASMRQALSVLDAGGLVGIFPEGGLSRDGAFLPFQAGTGLLIKRSRVPVYPVAIEGTHRAKTGPGAYLIPKRAAVCWGKPMRFTTRADAQQLTGLVEAAVHSIKPASVD